MRGFYTILALQFSFLINTVSAAELDLGTLTEQELNALTEEQLSTLPAHAVYERFGIETEVFDAMVKLGLYTLFYAFPDSPPVEDQIKEFQRDNGFVPDGILKTGEAGMILTGLANMLPNSILLSGSGEPDYFGDFAVARGSWAMADDNLDAGDNLAFRVNEASIECLQSTRQCVEKIYRFNTHDFDDGKIVPRDSYYFYSDEIRFEITKWQEGEITAEKTNECSITTMTLNFGAKEVTKVTRNNGGTCKSLLGVEIPRLDRPEVLLLKDGFDTSREYFEEIGDIVRGQWSKDFLDTYKERIGGLQN